MFISKRFFAGFFTFVAIYGFDIGCNFMLMYV